MGTFADFEDEDWENAFNLTFMSVVRFVLRGAASHAEDRWRAHYQRDIHVC